MQRKSRIIIWLCLIFFSFYLHPAQSLDSISVLSGYLNGDLKGKSDYEVVPIMVSFGFDLKKAAAKIGIHTKGILEFQLEPFLSPVISPDVNLETGVSFLLKYAFPLNKKLFPYIKIGAGPAFISQHTREQSTQFNFVDTAAFGFSWFIKENMSLDIEYRFRHLSNAGIKHPNHGIDANVFLIGFSRYF